jgi:hypothetical protein
MPGRHEACTHQLAGATKKSQSPIKSLIQPRSNQWRRRKAEEGRGKQRLHLWSGGVTVDTWSSSALEDDEELRVYGAVEDGEKLRAAAAMVHNAAKDDEDGVAQRCGGHDEQRLGGAMEVAMSDNTMEDVESQTD